MTLKGWKNPLTQADLWDLLPSEQANLLFLRWNKFWQKGIEEKIEKRSREPVSILKPLMSTFGGQYLKSSFVQLMQVILTQISPKALDLLIGFVSSDEEEWKGYMYMVFLVGINFSRTFRTWS